MVRLPKTEQESEDYLMNIGEIVKHYRCERGLSQQDLAAAAGVSYPRISEIERGHANPTIRTLAEIAKQLDVELHQLFVAPKKTKKRVTTCNSKQS